MEQLLAAATQLQRQYDELKKRTEELQASLRTKQEEDLGLDRLLAEKRQSLAELERRFQLGQAKLKEQESFVARLDERATGKVKLNVGGQHFTTSRTTLTAEPDSMLAAMFSGRHQVGADDADDGAVFLDRDPAPFASILLWLRTGAVEVPTEKNARHALEREASYYGLSRLSQRLEQSAEEQDDDDDGANLGKKKKYNRLSGFEFHKLVFSASRVFQLRSLDLREFNLSYVNLGNVTMVSCNLEGVNMTKAYLEYAKVIDCNLKQVNLSGACFENAYLENSIFTKATLSTVKGKSIFQSCDLSFVDLSSTSDFEASIMNSNCKGINLTKTTISGTMDNSDFTGSNMTGAVLQGDWQKAKLTDVQTDGARKGYGQLPPGFTLKPLYPG